MSKWLRAYILSCGLKWLLCSPPLVSRVSCLILGAVLFNYFVAVFLLLCGPCQLLCQFGLTLSCVCDVKRLPKQFETLKLQTKECHLFFGIKLAAVHVQFLLFDHCLFFMFSRARLKSGGWVGPFVVLWPRPAQMILSIPPCVHKGRKGSHQKLWEVRTYFGSKDLFVLTCSCPNLWLQLVLQCVCNECFAKKARRCQRDFRRAWTCPIFDN